MSRKLLFFLSADSFHVHAYKGGKLETPYYFSSSPDGLQRFTEFLKNHPEPAYVLTDMIEEDFRMEAVPHLTGANHQALLQRKFDQYYRNTPFRQAILQQRQAEGRRDDEMLFAALTNASRISYWLDQMLALHTPVAGIYSVPHVCEPLVRHIDSDHLLLISWEKNAGLRQSYFFNKRLRFSRLTPIHQNVSFADVIATESARTQQYLQSLSLTPPGQPLDVQIICHQQDRTLLDAKLSGNAPVRYSYLDINQLSHQFKCDIVHPDSDATAILLHLLATQTPKSNYASSSHRHYFNLWQAQRNMFGLAGLAALACLIWSSFSYVTASSMIEDTANIKQQLARMQSETQSIIQQLPASISGTGGSTISAADMKSAVIIFRTLQQNTQAPQKILEGLGATLEKFSSINTLKLGWQISNNAGMEHEITYEGELSGFGNDYRRALEYFDRLQQALSKSGYTVTPVQLPLDFSSKSTINDDINLVGAGKSYAFSLKMSWRPQP